MTHLLHRSSPLALALLLACSARGAGGERDFGREFRARAAEFAAGLSPAQAAAVIVSNVPAARWKMQYTGGAREGLPLAQLPAAARAQAEALVRSLLSEAGWRQALEVAAQNGPDGLGKYYIALFGDPRAGDFALRVAEHHLTLVQLELKDGEVAEFGPILLGCDPPLLWRDEERAAMDLWAALGPGAEAELLPGRGIASEPAPAVAEKGRRVADLPPAARAALDHLWEGRLAFFSEPVRARIARLVDARGGPASMRMAFLNEPAAQRCVDGGRWDWKLVGEGMLVDFETSRRHIHMSLSIR